MEDVGSRACGTEAGEDEMDETRTVADISLTPNEISERRQEIKNKILAVGRMQRIFQLLRCVALSFLPLENILDIDARAHTEKNRRTRRSSRQRRAHPWGHRRRGRAGSTPRAARRTRSACRAPRCGA